MRTKNWVLTEARKKAIQHYAGTDYVYGRGVVHANVVSALWWRGLLEAPKDWTRARIFSVRWMDVPFRLSEDGELLLKSITS